MCQFFPKNLLMYQALLALVLVMLIRSGSGVDVEKGTMKQSLKKSVAPVPVRGVRKVSAGELREVRQMGEMRGGMGYDSDGRKKRCEDGCVDNGMGGGGGDMGGGDMGGMGGGEMHPPSDGGSMMPDSPVEVQAPGDGGMMDGGSSVDPGSYGTGIICKCQCDGLPI